MCKGKTGEEGNSKKKGAREGKNKESIGKERGNYRRKGWKTKEFLGAVVHSLVSWRGSEEDIGYAHSRNQERSIKILG